MPAVDFVRIDPTSDLKDTIMNNSSTWATQEIPNSYAKTTRSRISGGWETPDVSVVNADPEPVYRCDLTLSPDLAMPTLS